MAASAIFKTENIANISAMDGPILTKFGTVTCLSPPGTIKKTKFHVVKNSKWWLITIWKIKKLISQKHLRQLQHKFTVLMHNGPP